MKTISKSNVLFEAFLAFAAVGTITVSQAATVSITGWELRNIDGVTAAGGLGFSAGGYDSVTHAFDGIDSVFSFSVIGDLDGLGIASDTLTFNLRVEAYTGSTVDAVTGEITLGMAYDLSTDGTPDATNQHFGPGFDLDPAQSVTISIENVAVVRGEVDAVQSASFTEFNEVSVFGGGAVDKYIGVGGATTLVNLGANGQLDLSGLTSATITQGFNTAGATRLRDLDFTFEVSDAINVPEPSSTVLLGLGGLALIARRRR